MSILKRVVNIVPLALLLLSITGCHEDILEEKQNVTTDVLKNDSQEEILPPTKEEVLKMRNEALEGMEPEAIDRLKENIKVANQQMESAYLYDELFKKLEDEKHLYWNYFDKKGDIQVGWSYEGDYKEYGKIREDEDLTLDEFYQKYGEEVIVYNRFDADNFAKLMEEMKQLVFNENLQNDLQFLANETKLAKETHEVEHVLNIYRMLHDMDYYLLRYGVEDVGEYTKDASTITKYYGVLSIYQQQTILHNIFALK